MKVTSKLGFAAILLTMSFLACKDHDKTTPEIKVTTYAATEITATSAQVGGHVIVTGDATVTELGICWSTETNPTAENEHRSTAITAEPFNCTLTSLQPETTYHIRAYAISDSEYHYGNDISFITLEGGNTPTQPQGALNGLFSVSENQLVRFSQGNLQYQASTNTWRFAQNQTDYIGNDNTNISETYIGWIDLFGWATSGYSHGATCYLPWSTSENYTSYYAYGNVNSSLFDGNGQADWGYNAISNGGNQEGLWRTLRSSEWAYLLETRQTASGIRFAMAEVGGTNGLLLFPDNWDISLYTINKPNEFETELYTFNTITVTDWTNILEAEGVVFLPCGGMRVSTEIYYASHAGVYWAATSYNAMNVFYFYFEAEELGGDASDVNQRNFGMSVRLVQDYEK